MEYVLRNILELELLSLITLIMSIVVTSYCKRYKVKEFLIGDIRKEMETIKACQLRLELMYLIEHEPTNIKSIMHTYDDYKKTGCNSYIHEDFKKWKSVYSKK